VRGADEAVSGLAHLTLPGAFAPGPLPLPPEGRRGALFLNTKSKAESFRLNKAAVLQPISIPRTALRFYGNIRKKIDPACEISRSICNKSFASDSLDLGCRCGERGIYAARTGKQNP
jgi:hypothetical protein